MENSAAQGVILKAHTAYAAYRRCCTITRQKLMAYLEANPRARFASMVRALRGPRCRLWVNLGGQLMPAGDLEKLKAAIKSGKLNAWPDVHRAYDALWEKYPLQKQRHALATLVDLVGPLTLSDGAPRAG